MSSTPTDSEEPSSESDIFTPVVIKKDDLGIPMVDLYGIEVDAGMLFMHAGPNHFTVTFGPGLETNYIHKRWLESYFGHILKKRTMGV